MDAKASRLDSQSFGLALAHRWGRTEWLETPDGQVGLKIGERNRTGISPLTKIAAQLPRKLLRIPSY
jgi:hypothetical protein